jgi:hypothetical protein
MENLYTDEWDGVLKQEDEKESCPYSIRVGAIFNRLLLL